MKTFNTDLLGRVLSRAQADTEAREKDDILSPSELRVLFSDAFSDDAWRSPAASSTETAPDKAA